MSECIFTSSLPESHREALENLLFFNPAQQSVREDILRSIERFGTPRVVVAEGRLQIAVGDFGVVQSLFALTANDGQLIGSAIYLRDAPANLTVLHIAVAPAHLMRAPGALPLAVELFLQVIEVASRIKGITTVTVLYGLGKTIPYHLQPRK